jgi:ATP-binding cassette, subfamily F, member 3
MLAGLQNLTVEFGARTLVEDATWHIQPGERIGLVGYNGTGKSTLLKIFAGEMEPSKGSYEKSRAVSIGYLHQDLLSFDTHDSILHVALGAFSNILKLEKEIQDLSLELEKTNNSSANIGGQAKAGGQAEALLHEYSDKLHELETLGGYSIHHRTEEILQGLGFSNSDLQRPYHEFSGGWRMRVLLAKMILQKPDILLLDEPTNHLDLPSIEWLEKYLQSYPGSVVIVSHDKVFLNRMVKKIVELYQQKLHFYTGNYDYYEQEKALRLELQQKAYQNQQDYIRQQERFIERFRAKNTKATQAQSLLKKLDRLDRIEEAKLELPSIKINFRIDKIPGKVLSEIKNITKSFGENRILKNTSADIMRGDKIALIGANGKGKSTLLRIIAGTETFEGHRKPGHNVEPSFYAQHQLEALNLDNTIMEELQLCGSQKTELELRTLLGSFLFGGDDVDKKIRVLSGGEKARVALAKTIISRANFLLLDEPTNHLDMHSCELLATALNKYEGSYLLVSHDRYFISKTANKIWEIEQEQIKEFKGGYDEYVQWKQRMAEKADQSNKSNGSKESIRKLESKKQAAETSINKQLKKDIQRQQRIFQQLEEKLEVLKKRKTELETMLMDGTIYADKQKFIQTETEYKQTEAACRKVNAEYELAFEKLMALQAEGA